MRVSRDFLVFPWWCRGTQTRNYTGLTTDAKRHGMTRSDLVGLEAGRILHFQHDGRNDE